MQIWIQASMYMYIFVKNRNVNINVSMCKNAGVCTVI